MYDSHQGYGHEPCVSHSLTTSHSSTLPESMSASRVSHSVLFTGAVTYLLTVSVIRFKKLTSMIEVSNVNDRSQLCSDVDSSQSKVCVGGIYAILLRFLPLIFLQTAQHNNIAFILKSHFIKYSSFAWSETVSDNIFISTPLRNTPRTSHTNLRLQNLSFAFISATSIFITTISQSHTQANRSRLFTSSATKDTTNT
jgi:hypothetical protein